jgi:hypothetical protein
MYKKALDQQNEHMDLVTATAIQRFGGIKNPKTVQEMLAQQEANNIVSGVASMGNIGAHSYAMPMTKKEKDVSTITLLGQSTIASVF